MKHLFCRFVLSLMIITIISLSVPSNSYAATNWFSKFAGSTVKTKSNAWSSQKRGYVTGGGISIRTPVDTSAIFHITPPRLHAGCGGIDAFWGGFSFLNPKYLIQKLKNILQKAPAYAFELALTQLCQTCKSIINSLKAISDQLNAMAMDDCAIAQAIGEGGAQFLIDTLGIKSATGDEPSGGGTFLDGMLKGISDGLTKFEDDLGKLLDFKYGCDKDSDQARCRKKYILEGSMIDIAMEQLEHKFQQYPPNENFKRLMRAVYGDYFFTTPAKNKKNEGKTAMTAGTQTHVRVCPSAGQQLVSALTTLDPNFTYQIDISVPAGDDFDCVSTDVAIVFGDDYEAYSFGKNAIETLGRIRLEMHKSNGNIAESDIAFINQSVIPIYSLLNTLGLAPSQDSPSGKETEDPKAPEKHTFIDIEEQAAVIIAFSHASFFFNQFNEECMSILSYVLTNIEELGQGIYKKNSVDVQTYISQFQSRHAAVSLQIGQGLSTALDNYNRSLNQMSRVYNIRKLYQQQLLARLY